MKNTKQEKMPDGTIKYYSQHITRDGHKTWQQTKTYRPKRTFNYQMLCDVLKCWTYCDKNYEDKITNTEQKLKHPIDTLTKLMVEITLHTDKREIVIRMKGYLDSFNLDLLKNDPEYRDTIIKAQKIVDKIWRKITNAK